MKNATPTRKIGGPKTAQWLASIGVRTIGDVRRMGSVEIYRLLKEKGYPVSLNLVYGLEGELLGTAWNRIPADLKAELREAVRQIDRS